MSLTTFSTVFLWKTDGTQITLSNSEILTLIEAFGPEVEIFKLSDQKILLLTGLSEEKATILKLSLPNGYAMDTSGISSLGPVSEFIQDEYQKRGFFIKPNSLRAMEN